MVLTIAVAWLPWIWWDGDATAGRGPQLRPQRWVQAWDAGPRLVGLSDRNASPWALASVEVGIVVEGRLVHPPGDAESGPVERATVIQHAVNGWTRQFIVNAVAERPPAWMLPSKANDSPGVISALPAHARYASGWPLPCVEMVEAFDRGTRGGTPVEQNLSFWRTALHFPARGLPMHPLLPGLVINVCFWSALTALVLANGKRMTHALQVHWRVRRGCCPACGYTRRGLSRSSPCPECGHVMAR